MEGRGKPFSRSENFTSERAYRQASCPGITDSSSIHLGTKRSREASCVIDVDTSAGTVPNEAMVLKFPTGCSAASEPQMAITPDVCVGRRYALGSLCGEEVHISTVDDFSGENVSPAAVAGVSSSSSSNPMLSDKKQRGGSTSDESPTTNCGVNLSGVSRSSVNKEDNGNYSISSNAVRISHNKGPVRSINPVGTTYNTILSPFEKQTRVETSATRSITPISPSTRVWIYVDDDDDDDTSLDETTPAVANSVPKEKKLAEDAMEETTSQPSGSTKRGAQGQCFEHRAGALPSTFRTWKGALQARKASPRASSSFVASLTPRDSVASREEGVQIELTPTQAAASTSSPPDCAPLGCFSLNSSNGDMFLTCRSLGTETYGDNGVSATVNDGSDAVVSPGAGATDGGSYKVNEKEGGRDDDIYLPCLSPSKDATPPNPRYNESSNHVRSVVDLLFPTGCELDRITCQPQPSQRKRGIAKSSGGRASAAAIENDIEIHTRGLLCSTAQRNAELRPLFEAKLTRKSFQRAVDGLISKEYKREAGEFWSAFINVEYVGEGSFGFVWRCQTVRGDVVAVKSCPLSLRSKGSIQDAFSVLREIAVMRFLAKNDVPFVLPLYSAFFVQARECLPGDVAAALQGRERCSKGRNNVSKTARGRGGNNKKNKGAAGHIVESPEELKEGECNENLRLPKFLSISVEEALRCDATVFLVTELCRGDVENVERYEDTAEGVALCVGNALLRMHELGILHLDLKPSNILMTYGETKLKQIDGTGQRTSHENALLHSSTVPLGGQRSPSGVEGSLNNVKPNPKFYLSDFGNCQLIGPRLFDEVTGVIGTYEYMDFKALNSKSCSRATDCFSLGATLYELVFSKRLYPSCTNPKCKSDADHTRHCYLKTAQQPISLPLPPLPSPKANIIQKIMAGLLLRDPVERWTVKHCVNLYINSDTASAGFHSEPTRFAVPAATLDEKRTFI